MTIVKSEKAADVLTAVNRLAHQYLIGETQGWITLWLSYCENGINTDYQNIGKLSDDFLDYGRAITKGTVDEAVGLVIMDCSYCLLDIEKHGDVQPSTWINLKEAAKKARTRINEEWNDDLEAAFLGRE